MAVRKTDREKFIEFVKGKSCTFISTIKFDGVVTTITCQIDTLEQEFNNLSGNEYDISSIKILDNKGEDYEFFQMIGAHLSRKNGKFLIIELLNDLVDKRVAQIK